jgi:hypothetical protein
VVFLATNVVTVGDRRRGVVPFGAGVLVAFLAFFLMNTALLGKPLGIHARQIVDEFSFAERLYVGAKYLAKIVLEFVQHAPVLVGPLLLLGGARRWRAEVPFMIGAFLVASWVLLLSLPVIIPNDGGKQPGPRYLLVALPALALVATWCVDLLVRRLELRSRVVVIGGVLLLLVGVGRNFLTAQSLLVHNYQFRVAPALARLRSDPIQTIVVTQQQVAQDLAELFGTKDVLRAGDANALTALVGEIGKGGRDSFLLVSREIPLPGQVIDTGDPLVAITSLGHVATFDPPERAGGYRITKGRISRSGGELP